MSERLHSAKEGFKRWLYTSTVTLARVHAGIRNECESAYQAGRRDEKKRQRLIREKTK